jgi:hypothetical protein
MHGKSIILLLLVLVVLGSASVHAQVAVSAQLRTRGEYRDGQGTLSVRDTVPAGFVSQRTRVNLRYTGYRFTVYTAVQDVRVWGQDASSINRVTTDANDGLMLHEAWGEISLVDTGKVIKNFTLKIGRQELVYDDVRLLGNLDWLQQGRRHDAALLKFEHNGWIAHLGAGYNQNAERKANTLYNGTPTGYAASTNGMTALYKSMQFLYVGRKLPFGNASFLFFKDDFSKFHFAPSDTLAKTPLYERGAWSRYTVGGNLFGTVLKRVSLAATAFFQGGKYREGTSLHEYLFSLSALYAVNKKFSVGPGVDFTSGNNGDDPSKKYQRFDPLYGTPHKFWGYMDYFYVADGFGANGLTDLYLKSKLVANARLTCMADVHYFSLPDKVRGQDGRWMDRYLGTEIDFTAQYALSNVIQLEGGYGAMLASTTLPSPKVKNVKNADRSANWAYIMIALRPAWTKL